MKLFRLISLAIFSMLLVSSSLKAQDTPQMTDSTIHSGSMIIRLLDFSSNDGKVMVGLYDSKEGYESNKSVKGFSSAITDGKVEYVLENIPFGTYAIKCYHDENLNGKMDANMMGIPTEDYGFSNNASGSFGPAEYEDAKFEFSTDKQIVVINID